MYYMLNHWSHNFIYQIDSFGDTTLKEKKLGIYYQVTQCPGQKLDS